MSTLSQIPILLTLAAASGPATPDCPAVRTEDRAWVDGVSRWIDGRTDPVTGLPASYDQTVDHAMDGQGAIYDLAITAILLAETCQLDSAIRIIDRLELMWTGRGLPNVVAVHLATTGLESVAHTGPNAWVALAAHRVWRRAGNIRHLRFAQAIGDWIVRYREHDDGKSAAPPWLSPPSFAAPVRAPAMGPGEAFSPVGAVLPWHQIVSTEHALDVYALLTLLADEPAVPTSRARSYHDALADIRRYLQVAATNPTCRGSAGVGLREGDHPNVCIETGFKPAGKNDASFEWSREFNAADVYYWWVAAIPDLVIAGAPAHQDILATARVRFHQVVHLGDQTISGTDYFTCTAAPEDQECWRPNEGLPLLFHDPGAPADGSAEHDAGPHEPPLSVTVVEPSQPGALGKGNWRNTCNLLGADVCAGDRRKVRDARGFVQFERSSPTVSVEWTGEAILANRLVGKDASQSRESRYAAELVGSMDHLQAITAIPGGTGMAYPYASNPCECVFDGGWLTPALPDRGPRSSLPGSLAGTVWVAFGRLGINPFDPKRVPPMAAAQPARPPTQFLTVPSRLARPPCPVPSDKDPASTTAQIPAFDPAKASPETLVSAAWLCLDQAKGKDADAQRPREAIKVWVEEALGRHLVDAEALSVAAKNAAIPSIGIEALARRQQDRAFRGPGCRLEDFALNEVATARLIRALANRRSPEACEDASAIVQSYPSGCFWHPREVPGEPHDRFKEQTSNWTVVGSPPRLAGGGYFVPVTDDLASELPDCMARLRDAASGRDAEALAEARQSRGVPWLFDAETHAYGADNLFFSEQHRGIGVLQGEGRLGLAPTWGPVTMVPYVYGRGIEARGASPLDRAVWLRNWGVGGGVEARLAVDRPVWLRELDLRLGLHGGHIGYHTPAAPSQLTDWEVLATLSGWSLAYLPVSERNGLWAEVGASAYGGQATLWSVDQRSLWLTSKVEAGARLRHLIEVYAMAQAMGNLLQDTDWDNNLRLGIGGRLPLLYFADGPGRRFVLLVDGFWEHTVAYWPWVDYVPSFRPLSDCRISVDAWFAWSGR